MIKIEELYAAIDGGLPVFAYYYPQIDINNPKKAIKIREDDKNASAGMFLMDGIWFIKDQGGPDNRPYSAVELVRKMESLDYKDSIQWIAEHFAPQLVKNGDFKVKPCQPVITPEAPQSQLRIIKRESGKFTQAELDCLGYKITQKICDEFNLIPLDGYITKESNGKSWKISSTDTYPIYFYDYGDWGKIYQPKGEVRFLYYGKKQANFMFGCNKFRKAWEDAEKKKFPHVPGKPKKRDDYTHDADEVEDEEKDERWENLTICSGPSDALNVYACGHIVCWPNSETEPINPAVLRTMFRLARNVYVLYDADETGVKNAYKLALTNLDIKIISLPADLSDYKTQKGKPCKDIKDFMMYYKRGKIDPQKEFIHRLVKLAMSLKFWIETFNDKTLKSSFDISNQQLFRFLSANGFYKMPTISNTSFMEFVFVKGRVVELIPENMMVSRCKDFLIKFLENNVEYYSLPLVNAIHRSKQLNTESMRNLETITPDFSAFNAQEEYFFFRNTIVRANAEGLSEVKGEDCPYYVLKHKVIQHDFHPCKRKMFEFDYSETYKNIMEIRDSFRPHTPDWNFYKSQIDILPPGEVYELKRTENFDFIRFVYNTGNKFWREEAEAIRNRTELIRDERNIVNLNFINKVTTLGYLISKFKEDSVPKAVFAIESCIAEEDEGAHKGGTGKSFFLSSVDKVRNREFINGVRLTSDLNFIYQGVNFDTDIIQIDDLAASVDMNKFLVDITGPLTINKKNLPAFVIRYKDSPKFCFTSNHVIKRYDDSLKRRLQFISFSDYYHSSSKDGSLKEFNPRIEFGRNLITDYDEEDMNKFYNFMLECVVAFKRFGLVEPDLDDINNRMERARVGYDFIDWADDYFEERFTTNLSFINLINKEEAYMSWKSSISKNYEKHVNKNTFTSKMRQWCDIRKYTYNPSEIMRYKSTTEQKRDEIRQKDSFGKVTAFFVIYAPEKKEDS